jgi:hypothetical protein
MIKFVLLTLLPSLFFFGNFSEQQILSDPAPATERTYEKMAAASGTVSIRLDLNALYGSYTKDSVYTNLGFRAGTDSFFTAIATDEEFRGLLPSSLPLLPEAQSAVPRRLGASLGQLIVESTAFGSHYSLVLRDTKTGFAFFNIEGHEYVYQPHGRFLSIKGGRLLLSKEYAEELGRPNDAGRLVGEVSIDLSMRAIEIAKVVDGAVVSDTMPASPEAGTVPGPDVVVGDLNGLFQPSGTVNGTQVGLAVGTNSCNFGTVDLNWKALPENDHPVIPQNMYRMSGGANNDERFEQIGQSSVKHAFTALTQDICNLGCNGNGGNRLGSGCSDPYSASLNAGPNLGSRAWINPFTGAFPSGGTQDSYPSNNHTGHAHEQKSHRILTEISDLAPDQNPGATYYAESQYITPHEYAWCQANPTQCNMYNNVSYRRYNVTTAGSPFSFSPAAGTERAKPALSAWIGSTQMQFAPDPGNDGICIVAYKVTNPSAGVWRYEYAVYNQNLDRAIRMFSVPIGNGATVSNVGFHAPPQHPGWAFDGTNSDAGYSDAPWTSAQNAVSLAWATETLAQNPNANAIRWGTMYNFRFESNRPPQAVNATVGFLKTGLPITVAVSGPSAAASVNITVAGKVTTTLRGVSYAKVTLTDSQGQSRVAYTNTFGYFSFPNVASNHTYTVSILKNNYTFTPQQISPSSDLTNMSFFAPRDPTP